MTRNNDNREQPTARVGVNERDRFAEQLGSIPGPQGAVEGPYRKPANWGKRAVVAGLGLAALLGIKGLACSGDDPVGDDDDTYQITQVVPQACAPKDISGQYTPIGMAEGTRINDNKCGFKSDLENITTGDSLTVFYRSTSNIMHDQDVTDARNFFRQHQKAAAWIVEGYADQRGDLDFNNNWGLRRATGMQEYLEMFGANEITVISHGEAQAKATAEDLEQAVGNAEECKVLTAMRYDRKVVVTPVYMECPGAETTEAQIISQGLTRLPAGDDGAYLLDLSDSMVEEVSMLRGHDFGNSDVYAFNTCNGVFKVDNANDIRSCGFTPLWDSAVEVIERNGIDTLTLMTDGKNNSGKYSVNDVIRVAQEHDVKVNVIGAGEFYTDREKQELASLADQTGGDWYIRN
jgi:outer membrane protein OmpA-like peptidoglycan-associated protein